MITHIFLPILGKTCIFGLCQWRLVTTAESLEASVHRWHGGWDSIVSNDVTGTKNAVKKLHRHSDLYCFQTSMFWNAVAVGVNTVLLHFFLTVGDIKLAGSGAFANKEHKGLVPGQEQEETVPAP